MIHSCYIGVGANLGDPLQTLRAAAAALHRHAACRVLHNSPIYQSAPIGPDGQNDYLNAVISLETSLAPSDLLDCLQGLERAAGRVRGTRWGPRTLDLDLLLYDAQSIESARLQVPHPRLGDRNFVLQPLIDICGASFELPDGSTLGELLAKCPANPLQRLKITWDNTAETQAG